VQVSSVVIAPVIAGFEITRPRYEVAQHRILAWLAAAHAEAEAAILGLDADARAELATKLARVIERVGCGPDRIARRGQSIADIETFRWEGDGIYDIRSYPHGRGTAARTRAFAEIVDAYFAEAYAGDATPPDDLIHVTCTGYASPSGAQKLVAARRWPTRVTHAFHMGCYAAIPALRIARGFVATGARRVDLVHTELCSLHVDPTDHALEQLVVQSLFADGFVRYSASDDHAGPGLAVRALHEQLVPESADAMTWTVGDHGMQMTLARDVPDRIAAGVRHFVVELFARGGVELARLHDGVVAVHPGGPKIIDRVRDALELDDVQVAASRGVLRDYGNMSSATLPHIWARVIDDSAVAPGSIVASLAFGPGLTMCGALLEKR
jgi:predicted naringenin-chalcone synthase